MKQQAHRESKIHARASLALHGLPESCRQIYLGLSTNLLTALSSASNMEPETGANNEREETTSHLKKYLAEDLVSKLRTGKTSPNNILGCTEICCMRIGLLHISEKVKYA